MGRTQRALTSLVAAIPAGFLAYLLVMVFLKQADSLTTITQVVVGLTLACAALVVLMPFGLLIFGGRSAGSDDVAAAPAKAKGKGKPAADDLIDDSAVEEVSDEIVEDDDDAGDIFGGDDDLGSASDDDIMADSDDAISAGSSETLDTFDFDDEEDSGPKKKKKK